MKRAIFLFALLLVVMTAAMTAITRRMLLLERQEQLQALREENERLALWRLESYVLPILLREGAQSYDALLRADRAVQRLPKEVLCYFRGDDLIGLEAITINPASSHALSLPATQITTDAGRKLVNELQQLVGRAPFLNAFGEGEQLRQSPEFEPEVSAGQRATAQRQMAQMTVPAEARQQTARSQNEFLSRSQNALSNSAILDGMPWETAAQPKVFAPMHGFWFNQRLFLARTVGAGSKLREFEGCVLDWQLLEGNLLAQITDLLPAARLVPLLPHEEPDHHTLANLPLRLVPGSPDLAGLPTSSALQPTLIIAWTCFMVGALALGGLVVGISRLSERRSAFVSAVTHELRTPLTTFRLYADLLGSQALSDNKRTRYLETLKAEAERLQYLIENVLSWSGLERAADTQHIETLHWNEEITRIETILRERLAQAGMVLRIQPLTDAPAGVLGFRGNRTAVERILFNLVDNACKYARSGKMEVTLRVTFDDRWLRVRVCDSGPGIAPEMRRQLFKPFSKSAQQAAQTAPGVGLGLSLSRRIARAMRGELELLRSDATGTEFELRLPATTKTA